MTDNYKYFDKQYDMIGKIYKMHSLWNQIIGSDLNTDT